MEILEFHDSLLVGIEEGVTDLALSFEWVFVYVGDQLVRQEGGVLHFVGAKDWRVGNKAGTPRLKWEYGRVLDLSLESGIGKLLVEWVGSDAPWGETPDVEMVSFAYMTFSWHPQFVHAD